MGRTARVLRMLAHIRRAPGISVETLAKAINISERGVYRYIAEVKALEVKLSLKDGGYVLADSDILASIQIDAIDDTREI